MMKGKVYSRQPANSRIVFAIVLFMWCLFTVGSGYAQTDASLAIEKTLLLGGSELLDFDGIKRMAVSDPSVVDYVVLSTRQTMLLPKKVGEANLYVWDNKGQHAFHLRVVPPPSRTAEQVTRIAQVIANPAIRVSESNDVIILEGEVISGDEAQRAETLAKLWAPKVENLIRVRKPVVEVKPAFDLDGIRQAVGDTIKITALGDTILLLEGEATPTQKSRLDQIVKALGSKITAVDTVTIVTDAPRQILVRVKVVEINKADLKELGVEWGGLNEDGAHDQPILFGETSTGPFPLDEVGPIRRLEGLSARLKALITTNRARVLAEPNLLVVERQIAQILVGGELPIPVVQNGGSGNGAISVEWKEFGVKLAMSAAIDADNQSISLDVTPEVSNLDYGNAIVVDDNLLPALQIRRVHSVLHIRNGQTLVIGGLYQIEQFKNQRKIPLLGDIPVLGELFKRTDTKERETELVVFVTPEIVTEASVAAQTEAAQRKIEEGNNVNSKRH